MRGALRFWNINTGGTSFTAPVDLTSTATHDMAWRLIGRSRYGRRLPGVNEKRDRSPSSTCG
jgi:hypothetical protein